jgi:NADH:ubiquinone oxidoreductase subunit 2 (subunit N)
MGYGLYGLLIKGGDTAVVRAGRLYLIFLILADLALFEALLLAAAATDDYRYAMVQQAMAENTASLMYLGMVLLGFAFKAAIWPCHLWLLTTFRSVPLSSTVLLGGVPVAMGLLGAIRWLPSGEHAFYIPGTALQFIGLAGILYAALRFFTRAPVKLWPAWITVAATGLFIAAVGTGLAQPAVWHQYGSLAHPLIASVGLFLTAATFAIGRWQIKHPSTDFLSQHEQGFYLWAGRWIMLIQRWTQQRLLDLQSLRHTSWLQWVKHYRQVLDWKIPEVFLPGWRGRIILFVFLGLILAWLAK